MSNSFHRPPNPLGRERLQSAPRQGARPEPEAEFGDSEEIQDGASLSEGRDSMNGDKPGRAKPRRIAAEPAPPSTFDARRDEDARRREEIAARLAEAEIAPRRAYWRLAFGEALAHEALSLSPTLERALLDAERVAPAESYVVPGPTPGPRGLWTALADLSACAMAQAAGACDLSRLGGAETVRRFLDLHAAAQASDSGRPSGDSPIPPLFALSADHPESPGFYDGRGSGPRRAALIPDALIRAAESDAKSDAHWRFAAAPDSHPGMKAHALLFAAAQGAARGMELYFADRLAEADPLGAESLLTPDAQGFAAPAHSGAPMALLDARKLLTRKPFGPDLDDSALAPLVGVALRMLDDAHEVADAPLEAQAAEAAARRRVALKLGHVAEALAACGLHPDEEAWRMRAERWFAAFQSAAQRESAALAAEKGAYPAFDSVKRMAAPSARALDAEARAAMAQGLRCAAVTAWSPETETPAALGEDSARIALAALARRRLDAAGPARLIRPSTPQAALEALRAAWAGGANGAIFMDAPMDPILRRRARPRLAEPPAPAPSPAAAGLAPTLGAGGRPWRLSGATYAVEAPEGKRWLFTINESGGRPVEALIQARGELGAPNVWPEAAARLISAALAAGVAPEILAAALEEIEDPAGPSLAEGALSPSAPAALGAALRRHGGDTDKGGARQGPAPVSSLHGAAQRI